jgi:hypothetical protein
MLKLFQSIFGGNQTRCGYPESLIEMAIERAVDGTYPRLRAVPGYKKSLRAPVIHAIDHVISVVDSIPEILPATKAAYSQTFMLSAIFVSPDHMREVCGNDPVLSEFRESNPLCDSNIATLLLAECKEKNTLGVALEGDMLRRDVAQVTVSFGNHRLLAPATTEDESRRLLKHRAFDHLISLALMKICEAKGERAELNHHRELLKSKLGVLQKSGWNFDSQEGGATDHGKLQQELDAIEEQLTGLAVDDRTLAGQLEIVSDVLANAEKHVWIEPRVLSLDRMNIKREATNPDARELQFMELHNARGQTLAVFLVSANLEELPQRQAFLANANRILAELG